MCCSGLVSQVSSQPMLVLSALLALVKAVISARCICASFVRRSFDPLSCRVTSPQQKYAEWIHVSSSPLQTASGPLTIYDHNSCRYLLKRAIVVLAL